MTEKTEKQRKMKNIIVCADGTGNKGGSTPDSNVYKIYKAINKHFKGKTSENFECDEQVVFYDNGVGTEKNNYLRALGGGLGIGFEDNVRDLYKFLARSYNPGDRIYFFGFSRGASTVRACNGFIRKCGLPKGKGKQNFELDELVEKAFSAYQLQKKKPEAAEAVRTSEGFHAVVPIHFMGVWDTVVALGFPTGTDVTGTASKIFNNLSERAGKWLDAKWWQHKFYHYKLTGNVMNAYQALAIDDERTAFWPFVWNEDLTQSERDILDELSPEQKHELLRKGEDGSIERSVEQVWFSGMHSNVGGGYERSGLASVPLYWMMLRAEKCGLKFEDGAKEDALHDSHVHGRMYDSRDGAAIMYRYHPREIENLCENRLNGGEIKIHRSVIERINHRTANYAPGQLPGKFEVVEDDPDAKATSRNPGNDKDNEWDGIRKEIDKQVLKRKCLYETVLTSMLGTIIAGFLIWIFSDEPEQREGLFGYIADILDYFVPGFLEPLVNILVFEYPLLLVALALLAVSYIKRRNKLRKSTTTAREKLRHLVIAEGKAIELAKEAEVSKKTKVTKATETQEIAEAVEPV